MGTQRIFGLLSYPQQMRRSLFFTTMAYLMYIMFSDLRRARRLLKKGLFTTGYISKQKKSSLFTELRRRLANYDTDHVVSFTERHGVKRETYIVAPFDATNRSWLYDLAYYRQPAGLLYLPDTNAVIITDMWQNYDYHTRSSVAARSLANRKPDSDYEKDKTVSLEHTENITQEGQEESKRKIRYSIFKQFILGWIFIIWYVLLYVIFLWWR